MEPPFATLDDAVHRVVIPLKSGNPFADAVRKSRFLNWYDRENPGGVLPTGDDLTDVKFTTSTEPIVTLLPEEFDTPARAYNPKLYIHQGQKRRFFSGELGNELSGKIVYFIATPSTDPRWGPEQIGLRMQIATRAAKDMNAERVFAVFTEFPLARQDRGESRYSRGETPEVIEKDRKKHGGQTDSVSVLLRGLMANGCDGVVTLHHHSGHFEKAAEDCLSELNMPLRRYVWDIMPTFLLAHYLQTTDIIPWNAKANEGSGIVFIAPDKRALSFVSEVREYTGFTHAGLSYMHKERLRPNDPHAIEKTTLMPADGSSGDYKDKLGIVMDDMIDTFGTTGSALQTVSEDISRFILYATHGIFAGDAENIMRRFVRISDVIVCDTRPSRLRALGANAKRKITLIKPAEMVAYVLAQCVEKGISPNEHLKEIYQKDPLFFGGLYSVKRFDQHYTSSE